VIQDFNTKERGTEREGDERKGVRGRWKSERGVRKLNTPVLMKLVIKKRNATKCTFYI